MLYYEEITDSELIERILDKNKNWQRCRKYIKIITWQHPTNELRFVNTIQGRLLQQRYNIKVEYTEPVSYGSYEPHWTDSDIIWTNVPSVEFEYDGIEL